MALSCSQQILFSHTFYETEVCFFRTKNKLQSHKKYVKIKIFVAL